MTPAQSIGTALTAMLIPFLADPSASAQVTRCCPPSANGYDSYNGPCSGAHLPSYGSNASSRGMPQPHQQIGGRPALESSLTGIDAYFQRRLLNEHYRRQLRQLEVARIRGRFETQRGIHNLRSEFADVIKMNQQQAEKQAQQSAPKRLTASEYNQLTGTISWALPFQEYDQFAGDRARIDALFAQRTSYHSGVMSRNYAEVRKAVERMKATLLAMQGELDGTTYTAAKGFLTSVAYEARFPVQLGLAQMAAK